MIVGISTEVLIGTLRLYPATPQHSLDYLASVGARTLTRFAWLAGRVNLQTPGWTMPCDIEPPRHTERVARDLGLDLEATLSLAVSIGAASLGLVAFAPPKQTRHDLGLYSRPTIHNEARR